MDPTVRLAFWPYLMQGGNNKVADVKALQYLLLNWKPGLVLSPDGVYGNNTVAAVIQY